MFTRIERRLIKEGLKYIKRNAPYAASWPLYYTVNDRTVLFEQLNNASCLFNDLNSLPWPADRCVICWREHSDLLMKEKEHHLASLHFVIREPSDGKMHVSFSEAPDKFSYVESASRFFIVKAFVEDQRIIVHDEMDGVTLFCSSPSDDKFVQAMSAFFDAGRHKADDLAAFNIYCDIATKFYDTSQSHWSWRHIVQNTKEDELAVMNESPFVIFNILCALSAIACPCHYIVTSTFAEGFGNKEERAAFTGKKVFCTIHYDRLYHVHERLADTDGESDTHVAPHYRRGHIRHLWKLAGLDRFVLPDDARDRVRLVKQHGVKRLYIHPAWIGQNEYEEDGVTHEIQAEDTELPPLN